jgi:Protein of unknown function (DUF2764)
MSHYYFLGTLLPELSIDRPPEITFREFEQLLKENLSSADFAKSAAIRNYYDILNLSAYWKREPFNPLGNLDEGAVEEAIVTRSGLPCYVFEFLDKYETDEKLLHHFSELLARFFQNEEIEENGFLKFYFTLERELRLVLLAFRAKKLGKDLFKELQYENPDEEIIAQMLAQKDASQYEPPEKYLDLKNIFLKYQQDPLKLQKALIEYRIEKIEERLGLDLFSIDRILGYMIELILLEKWYSLDKQKGKEMIDSMFKETS